MRHLVHNERTKYIASFMNNVGVAVFVGGAVLPVFSNDATIVAHQWGLLITGVLLGVTLMLMAFMTLGGLKE